MAAAQQTPVRDELDEDDASATAAAGRGWGRGPDPGARVQLRAGLHCGAVAGRVVGSRAFKYTLMGDAVRGNEEGGVKRVASRAAAAACHQTLTNYKKVRHLNSHVSYCFSK